MNQIKNLSESCVNTRFYTIDIVDCEQKLVILIAFLYENVCAWCYVSHYLTPLQFLIVQYTISRIFLIISSIYDQKRIQ